MTTTILVVGSGAREHALAWRLRCGAGDVARDDVRVLVTPGNAGIARDFPCVPSKGNTNTVLLAKMLKVDFVVVGPEQPLVDGLVDALSAAGIPAFGPTQAAARLEGSKAFMKDVVRQAGVRTADFAVCDDVASAQTFIDARIADGRGVVVKADGLCAGKGVTVCRDAHDALDIVTDMLGVHGAPRFGDASSVVVLEDLLPGVELSAFALCDGTDCVVLPLARDHKRLLDDDLGPNTGGMGAVAPLDARHGVPAAASRERLHSDVFVPVLREMAKRGVPFRGVLFAGLMVHDDVVSVLEFNVRFGDPETQALMVGMRADFVPTLQAIARGEPLPESASSLTSCAPTAVVVLAAHGYPDSPRAGDVITGLDETPAGAHVFCAGVRAKGGTLITSGGRVLSVTSSGDTFADALAHAYAAVDTVQFSGAQVRRDIGRSVREA